jgi:hypothetical protein
MWEMEWFKSKYTKNDMKLREDVMEYKVEFC